jgi:hypothetical protein
LVVDRNLALLLSTVKKSRAATGSRLRGWLEDPGGREPGERRRRFYSGAHLI